MSLLAAQALITNAELVSRVTAAIRKTADARIGWEGAAGDLARAAYRAPDAVVPSFMLRLATNGEVTAAACAACGHVETIGAQPVDTTIEWIVGDAWDSIATDLYGVPAQEPPTTA